MSALSYLLYLLYTITSICQSIFFFIFKII